MNPTIPVLSLRCEMRQYRITEIKVGLLHEERGTGHLWFVSGDDLWHRACAPDGPLVTYDRISESDIIECPVCRVIWEGQGKARQAARQRIKRRALIAAERVRLARLTEKVAKKMTGTYAGKPGPETEPKPGWRECPRCEKQWKSPDVRKFHRCPTCLKACEDGGPGFDAIEVGHLQDPRRGRG